MCLAKLGCRDVFVNALRMHVTTQDQRFQAALLVPQIAVRQLLVNPPEITLEPAAAHRVQVLSSGGPVAGAIVVLEGEGFRCRSTTAADGFCIIRYPQAAQPRKIVAWHPRLGCAATEDLKGSETQITLLPAAPHTVRVVDTEGNPIAGKMIRASVRVEGAEWITTHLVRESHVRTDENGEAVFAWFPARGLKYVEARFAGMDWKVDETDRDKIPVGLTNIHAQKRRRVNGRVMMPPGVEAEGLLLTGFGFGPGSSGCIPYARTRADGSFTMSLPANHGLIIGVSDLQWSSPPWTGVFRRDESPEIEITAEPATPVEIRLTRGALYEPVSHAYVNLSLRGRVEYQKEDGNESSGSAGVGGFLRTDANGIARAGVGRGELRIRISADGWSETRNVQVQSTDPIEIAFHRAWVGNRTVKVKMTKQGQPFVASPDVLAIAWTVKSSRYDETHQTVIGDDSTIEVTFDKETASVLLLDQAQSLSGFATIDLEATEVVMPIVAMAEFSGRLVDDQNKQPLPDRTLELVTESSRQPVADPQQTDAEGRFSFANVPADVPLRLQIQTLPDEPEYFLFGYEKLFDPQERRADYIAAASLMDGNHAVERNGESPPPSLSGRLQSAAEIAGLMGLRVLVVVANEESVLGTSISEVLFDATHKSEDCRGYINLSVSADERKQLPETWLAQLPYSLGVDEVLMFVTEDGANLTGSKRLALDDEKVAMDLGLEFLRSHASRRDARDLLRQSLSRAQRSDRSVWVIYGGPSCGPCIRLARWINAHSGQLKKDLVVLKINRGIDAESSQAMSEQGGEKSGIPFHVMLSEDSEIMATSIGPLGNIGCASSIEGSRHFSKMLKSVQKRLTNEEIDELAKSLIRE